MAVMCLVAVAFAAFGHIEHASAGPAGALHHERILHPPSGPSHDDGHALPGQCHHHAQCAFQAVLPAEADIVPLAAALPSPAGTEKTGGLSLSPPTAPPRL